MLQRINEYISTNITIKANTMTITRFLQAVALLATALSVTFFSACGDSGGGGTKVSSDDYNGPGSKWDISLNNDNTFEISRRDNSTSPVTFTVTGDWEDSPSGFTILSVGNVEGTGGPSVGDTAWLIDIPGYALLLEPLEENSDQFVPAVVAGNCPTNDLSANWVSLRKPDALAANNSVSSFFGTYSYNAGTGNSRLASQRTLTDGFADQGELNIGDVSCEDGLASISTTQMYVTNNGGAIAQTSTNNETQSNFIFALEQKAITNVNNFDGDYIGTMSDGSAAAGSQVFPASMSCTGGTCNGNQLSGPEEGATTSNPWTLELSGTVDNLSPGLITGTLSSDDSSNNGNVACMIDTDVLDSGVKLISCVAQSPSDNGEIFNVVFKSI